MKRLLLLAPLVLTVSACTLRFRGEGTVPAPTPRPAPTAGRPAPPPAPPPGRPEMTRDEAVAAALAYVEGRGYRHAKVEDVELEDGHIWEIELRLHGQTKGEVELAYDRRTGQLLHAEEDIERDKGDEKHGHKGKGGKDKHGDKHGDKYARDDD